MHQFIHIPMQVAGRGGEAAGGQGRQGGRGGVRRRPRGVLFQNLHKHNTTQNLSKFQKRETVQKQTMFKYTCIPMQAKQCWQEQEAGMHLRDPRM